MGGINKGSHERRSRNRQIRRCVVVGGNKDLEQTCYSRESAEVREAQRADRGWRVKMELVGLAKLKPNQLYLGQDCFIGCKLCERLGIIDNDCRYAVRNRLVDFFGSVG